MGTLASSNRDRPCVLVVDDDHDVRWTIAQILGDEGYTVETANHGAEALELLDQGLRPSLILLDLRMPVMDGETFCQIWRSRPELAAIPICLISADANARAIFDSCGATSLLSKPVSLDDLLDTVEAYT